MEKNKLKSLNWEINRMGSGLLVQIPSRSEFIQAKKLQDEIRNLSSPRPGSTEQTSLELASYHAVSVEFRIPSFGNSFPVAHLPVNEARDLANWILRNTDNLLDLVQDISSAQISNISS